MTDRATKSLEHIEQSGEYVLVPDFVVFDEHDEFDDDGKLVRRFDRARLQTIADRCNARAEKSGDLAVIAPGHSIEDPSASEEDQPPPWGFARNYRLGYYGPSREKLGILCDAYIRRQIRTKDGRLVDGPEYVATFPRRSPELWPNHRAVPEHARNTFDWIALLRRAPQRDLGLSTYSRDRAGRVIGGVTRSFKFRYQMEIPMPNPVADPNAAIDTDLPLDDEGGAPEAPPEGHEEFAKHLDYAMANHPHLKQLGGICQKYAMDGGGGTPPGATNVAMPPAGPLPGEDDEDPALMQNSRRGGDVRKSKYQRQLDDQERRIKAAEAELAVGRRELRLKRYQMELESLATEYDLDVQEELADCVEMNDAAFQKHVSRIRSRYARTPVGHDLPHDAIATPGSQSLESPDVEAKIHRYFRDNPGFTAKHGANSYREAAKILNIVK